MCAFDGRRTRLISLLSRMIAFCGLCLLAPSSSVLLLLLNMLSILSLSLLPLPVSSCRPSANPAHVSRSDQPALREEAILWSSHGPHKPRGSVAGKRNLENPDE
jgi:hypothetical protein